jgi:hypothetical protein
MPVLRGFDGDTGGFGSPLEARRRSESLSSSFPAQCISFSRLQSDYLTQQFDRFPLFARKRNSVRFP